MSRVEMVIGETLDRLMRQPDIAVAVDPTAENMPFLGGLAAAAMSYSELPHLRQHRPVYLMPGPLYADVPAFPGLIRLGAGDPVEAMGRALRRDRRLLCPGLTVAAEDVADRMRSELHRVQDERTYELHRDVRALHAFSALRPPESWRDTYARRPRTQPRVAFITSIHTLVLQQIAEELAEGFRAHGWRTRILREGRTWHRLTWGVIAAHLVRYQPDLVFQIGHHRAERGYHHLPRALPCATYLMDRLPPLYDPRLARILGRTDFAFAMWPALAEELRAAGGYEKTHLSVLPPWSGGRVYREAGDLADAPIPHCPEVVVVSNLSSQMRTGDRRWKQRMLLATAAAASRHSAVIHGLGWMEQSHLRHIVAPPVHDRRRVAQIYRSAKCVLTANLDTNAHPRILEILAAGGLPIVLAHASDSRPGGLGDLLRPGKEVVVVRDLDEMISAIRRACTEPNWRQRVIAQGRRRVLRDHGVASRVGEMLRVIGEGVRRVYRPRRRWWTMWRQS